jgi:hypothetical protein
MESTVNELSFVFSNSGVPVRCSAPPFRLVEGGEHDEDFEILHENDISREELRINVAGATFVRLVERETRKGMPHAEAVLAVGALLGRFLATFIFAARNPDGDDLRVRPTPSLLAIVAEGVALATSRDPAGND